MLLTWSLIYIWHELFLTPQIWNWKTFTAFSRIDVVMLWMCIFCMHTMSINFLAPFKICNYFSLVFFSFICLSVDNPFIHMFFSLCLFVCIYFIVWSTSCTNGDLNPSNFVRSCIFGGLKLNDCVCPTFSQRFTSRSYPQAYTVIQIPFFKCKSWEGGLLWLKEVMMTCCSLWNL